MKKKRCLLNSCTHISNCKYNGFDFNRTAILFARLISTYWLDCRRSNKNLFTGPAVMSIASAVIKTWIIKNKYFEDIITKKKN